MDDVQIKDLVKRIEILEFRTKSLREEIRLRDQLIRALLKQELDERLVPEKNVEYQ